MKDPFVNDAAVNGLNRPGTELPEIMENAPDTVEGDASQGGEFLDDAIRMKEQPLKTQ